MVDSDTDWCDWRFYLVCKNALGNTRVDRASETGKSFLVKPYVVIRKYNQYSPWLLFEFGDGRS